MFLRYPLTELQPTRQVKGEPARRWFASPGADLIVWLRDDGSLQGFQFCYDKEGEEHALTWMEAHGYSHMAVETGPVLGRGSGTPLLVPDGAIDAARILEIYRAESSLVPAEYSAIVVARLEALAEKLEQGAAAEP